MCSLATLVRNSWLPQTLKMRALRRPKTETRSRSQARRPQDDCGAFVWPFHEIPISCDTQCSALQTRLSAFPDPGTAPARKYPPSIAAPANSTGVDPDPTARIVAPDSGRLGPPDDLARQTRDCPAAVTRHVTGRRRQRSAAADCLSARGARRALHQPATTGAAPASHHLPSPNSKRPRARARTGGLCRPPVTVPHTRASFAIPRRPRKRP